MHAMRALLAACLAAAVPAAAFGADPYAPSRLEVRASAGPRGTAPAGLTVTLRVRNAGIEDLTGVRVASVRVRNAGLVSKERGARGVDAPGRLGDLPVGTGRTFRLHVQPARRGSRVCVPVRVAAGPAAPVTAEACVPAARRPRPPGRRASP